MRHAGTVYVREATALTRYVALGIVAFLSTPLFGAPSAVLDRQFTETVRPVITKYCVGCHSGNAPAAQFDLKAYDTISAVVRDYPRWELVLARLTANEMPPKQAPPAAIIGGKAI